MVLVAMGKWKQTPEDLRRASLHAPHARTRERFQALYLIASGAYNATSCAAHIGRHDETVLDWVHRYNEHGPDALSYRRTGGHSPLLPRNRPNSSLISLRRPTPAATACRGTTGR
jgi:transposase